jgi:tetratricopeptide (TPR) repeat protein
MHHIGICVVKFFKYLKSTGKYPRVLPMLKWLVRWLKRFVKSSYRKKTVKDRVVKQPPELTNADLEYLFTQLLEGVYQGRGKQWAIKYLQRIEHRVSSDRWITWLLDFGEKLLTSPAVNHQLAEKMVQLGELGIGSIGDLSYDLGIRLLTRNLGKGYWQTDKELATPTAISISVPPANTQLAQDLSQATSQSRINTSPSPVTTNDHPWWKQEDGNVVYTTFTTTSSQEEDWKKQTQKTSVKIPSLQEAETYFYQGLQQAKIGNLSKALACYDKALQLQPDVCEYWFNRGLTLFYLGNFAEAIASFDKVVELKPDFYKGWYHKGAALSELEHFNEASACFSTALELKADYQQAWFGQGLVQLKLGYPQQAIACFEQALQLEPQDFQSWYLLGVALAETELNYDAVASYDKAIELNPDFDLAWYRRGLALANIGFREDAIANYHQATKINPEFHQAWYSLGNEMEKLGRWEEALTAYERVTQLDPNFHDAWVDQGVVLAHLGYWEDAIVCWDKAIAINNHFYLTWFNRGVAFDRLGHREEAIRCYSQAIEIKPDFYFAWYNLGVTQFHLGRFEEAIASYDRALILQPDYWEAWLGRGNAAYSAVSLEAIVQPSARNSITVLNPALNERGYQGKLASFQQGLSYLSPQTHPEGWGRLHLAIGNAHYDQGKKHFPPRHYWLQAVNAYEEALVMITAEAFPLLHLEVLQNLIKTLVVLGEKAAAQAYQQRAISALQNLLNQSDRSDESKKQLALKFAGIAQLTVDIAILYGDLALAWEIIEQGKNACFHWLLFGWTEEIYSPTFAEVHQLLNPTTAIVYWHITPCTLRTFVIKYNSPEPIPIFTPVLNYDSIDELPVPEAVARLIEFEKWIEEWNQQYQAYQNLSQPEQSKHSWRLDLERKFLVQLKNILNISALVQELEEITQLILIPHQQLHRLPLHALFYLACEEESPNSSSPNFTITYLPTAQIGISLKSKLQSQTDKHLLLSIEQPNSIGYARQKFATIEAELISQLFENCQRLIDLQASKQQVKNVLHKYNILHFIGQVTENLLSPNQSELILAESEKFTLEEISQNFLSHYKLIVLSSENFIANSPSIATEYVGISNALINLGVACVVENLWTTDPAVNTLFMIEFYRRIKLNKPIVTAFAEAITWLRKLTAEQLTKWYEDILERLPAEELRIRAHLKAELYRISQIAAEQKIYNHPYYWAGFKIISNFY